MTNIISITGLKGGVGKTTTAINLAASFAILEKKTLIIDCDHNGNAARGLGIDSSSISWDITHVLTENIDIREAIYDTLLNNLKFIPGKSNHYNVENFIDKKSINTEKIFADKIKSLSGIYDYIIIDTSSTIDFLTKSALSVSGWALIPLTYYFYTLDTIQETLSGIKKIKNRLNPSLSIAGLLLTMYDKRDYISETFSPDLFVDFDKLILDTIIDYDLKLNEALKYGKPIALYDIMAKSSLSHIKLADEIEGIINKRKKETFYEVVTPQEYNNAKIDDFSAE